MFSFASVHIQPHSLNGLSALEKQFHHSYVKLGVVVLVRRIRHPAGSVDAHSPSPPPHVSSPKNGAGGQSMNAYRNVDGMEFNRPIKQKTTTKRTQLTKNWKQVHDFNFHKSSMVTQAGVFVIITSLLYAPTSHVLQDTAVVSSLCVRCCKKPNIYFTDVRYDPAAGTAATAADNVGGALPPAPGALLPPRVDFLGTYNACESVFFGLLPTPVDGAALPAAAAARFPGTTTTFPCPEGFPPPAFILEERGPEFACALMNHVQSS